MRLVNLNESVKKLINPSPSVLPNHMRSICKLFDRYTRDRNWDVSRYVKDVNDQAKYILEYLELSSVIIRSDDGRPFSISVTVRGSAKKFAEYLVYCSGNISICREVLETLANEYIDSSDIKHFYKNDSIALKRIDSGVLEDIDRFIEDVREGSNEF